MFDDASRQLLEEHLGYERFVLNECAKAVQRAEGESSAIEIVVNDSIPHSINVAFTDYLGGEHGAAIVREMSPLAFSAAYKVLDMIIEWVIVENQGSCPWPFSQKSAILNAPLQYPDFVGQDPRFQAIIVALFRELLPYRNAITHGQWGNNNDGELDFDFTKNGQQFSLTVPFETVLNFGKALSLISELLVTPTLQTQERLNCVLFLLDRLHLLHQQQTFNITEPRHYHVVRRTNSAALPLSIDLGVIRQQISSQSSGNPSTFDLRVERQSDAWEIPFDEIPNTPALLLDETWDSFRTV